MLIKKGDDSKAKIINVYERESDSEHFSDVKVQKALTDVKRESQITDKGFGN